MSLCIPAEMDPAAGVIIVQLYFVANFLAAIRARDSPRVTRQSSGFGDRS